MNVLNNVTAAPFLVFFSAASCKKHLKNNATMTSLRMLVRSNNFGFLKDGHPLVCSYLGILTCLYYSVVVLSLRKWQDTEQLNV